MMAITTSNSINVKALTLPERMLMSRPGCQSGGRVASTGCRGTGCRANGTQSGGRPRRRKPRRRKAGFRSGAREGSLRA